MLTSITPLGERARGQRWWLTACGLVSGHLIGGLFLGSMLALVSTVVRTVWVASSVTAATMLGSAVVAAAILDISGWRLPGRRQVDEQWLTKYRGWVYGLGFGFQLGAGFFTVVNTVLFLVLVISAIVNPMLVSLGAGVLYGGVRGVLTLSSARVRTVGDLKTLHRRLDLIESRSMWGGFVVVFGAAGSLVGSVVI